MQAKVTTRAAQASDEAAFYRFICALEERELERAAFSRSYALNYGNSGNIYLISELGEEPVGILTCHVQHLLHHEGPVYEIQELYVGEPYRSQGVGRLLLEELLTRLSGSGIDTLEVSSNVRRTGAHRFYLREGFVGSHLKFTRSFKPVDH